MVIPTTIFFVDRLTPRAPVVEYTLTHTHMHTHTLPPYVQFQYTHFLHSTSLPNPPPPSLFLSPSLPFYLSLSLSLPPPLISNTFPSSLLPFSSPSVVSASSSLQVPSQNTSRYERHCQACGQGESPTPPQSCRPGQTRPFH